MISEVFLALEHMAGLLPEMPLTMSLVAMFYRYVFYIAQCIDSRLQAYARPLYMFREWVCVGIWMHVYRLGVIFSRNVWLNNLTRSTTGSFDFEAVCHSAVLMSTSTCCAYRLWHAWQAAPRVRSVLLLCTSGGMWCAWCHNATPQVFRACPFACRVPSPFHDSCTACIVGVARGTSAEFRLVPRASCCLAVRAFLMPRSTEIPHCKVLRESREQITSKPEALCLRFKGVVHYSP